MNSKVECPSCSSTIVRAVCAYKHLMTEDELYLGKMRLVRCCECDLVFASPLPSSAQLDRYYGEIYRKSGRPHYVERPESVSPNMWHESQYWFISQFVDFKNLDRILDLGPGYGYLLRKIRSYHSQINLTASDPDVKSLSYLKNYQINLLPLEQIKNSYGSTEQKFDLILSSHSLEHEKDPFSFFELVKRTISDQGIFFLEVPNTPYSDEEYTNVAYHGPHLLFFSPQSLRTLLQNGGFKIIHMTTAGSELNQIHVMMSELYYQYNLLDNRQKMKPTQVLKSLIPRGVKNIIKAGFSRSDEGPNEFFKYGGNRWTIRAIAQKEC